MITVLTLALEPAAQAAFEELRQKHYPSTLNHIPAHVSLFHQLPGDEEVAGMLDEAAAATPAVSVQGSGVRSLGRGVAYSLSSPDLLLLHRKLAESFEPHLIPQDRQRFQPHVVVQNKVAPTEAKTLLAQLQASFVPHAIQATGLLWWEYLGGPWRLLEKFDFADADS